MGVHGSRRGPGSCGEGSLTVRIARVVPDVASFAVDRGFAYAVPDVLADQVRVGSLVRVPLGGRRVRGFVVEVGEAPAEGLKEIRAVSGDLPVFDERLLGSLRWAAGHYVAPLAVMLGRTAPPNVPRSRPSGERSALSMPGAGTLADVAAVGAAGGHHRPVYLLGPPDPASEIAATAARVLAGDRSVLVVAPTAAEVEALAGHLGAQGLGGRVRVASPTMSDREVTETWSAAASAGGIMVVGTQRVAAWPLAHLGLAVIVEEGRRALKDRQTPTVHARDLLRRRAAAERFPLVFVGNVPSTDVLASGAEVRRPPGRRRAWPLVEVVDRGEEPPSSGVVTERARMALRGAMRSGTQSFVFSHRHGYAPAFRCGRCHTVRVCPVCGSRPDRGAACRRCGTELGACSRCGGESFQPLGAGEGRVLEELRGVLGREAVAGVNSAAPIWVGTERDLAGAGPIGLGVAVDVDGLALGSNYRAGEDALRILARLASAVRPGRAHRLLVQTSMPGSALIEALRRGDPLDYLRLEIDERAPLGFPPVGELLVIEVRNGGDETDADGLLREAVAEFATLHGPATTPRGRRWLVQAANLARAKNELRGTVQTLRDSGYVVRIDADPLDL